jgi:hypothetical protein
VARRALTTFLWFVTGWAAGGVLSFVLGTPTLLAPVLGLAASAVVAWDPSGLIWGPTPDRALIRRRIADLERVAPAATAATSESRLEPAAD